MDIQAFEHLLARVRSCYFQNSKRDTINKFVDSLTAQQIYQLLGQFTGGNDRVKVVADLQTSKRILPMRAVDAEPIIKMGIYPGQRRDLLKALLQVIVDRQHNNARLILSRNFTGADNSWVNREIDQAGPYEGPPPVATVTGPGAAIISTNVVVANPGGLHYSQDPLSYVGHNTGTALFGGLFTADVPPPRLGVTNTVLYQGNVQQGQQVYYPNPNPGTYPAAVVPPPAQYHSNLYPQLPEHPPTAQPQGGPMNAPPAYTPVDANLHPQATAQHPPSSISYPPTNDVSHGQQLPEKAPLS